LPKFRNDTFPTFSSDALSKQVALKTLVDNIAVLSIESCLLGALKEAFTARMVMNLDDDTVQKIAAENQESVTERKRTQEKLRILETGLRTLKRYRRSQHQSIKLPLGRLGAEPLRQLTGNTDFETSEQADSNDIERYESNEIDSPMRVTEDVSSSVHDTPREVDSSFKPISGDPQNGPQYITKARRKNVKTFAAKLDESVVGGLD
jgi:hypothetical protein